MPTRRFGGTPRLRQVPPGSPVVLWTRSAGGISKGQLVPQRRTSAMWGRSGSMVVTPKKPLPPRYIRRPPWSEVGAHAGEHVGGPVLGVGAGEDDVVGGQQVSAFGVQVVVGDDVDFVAGSFEPVDEIEVGGEAGGGGPDAVAELGAHVEDGAKVGDVGSAGSVGVALVQAGETVWRGCRRTRFRAELGSALGTRSLSQKPPSISRKLA